MPRPLLFDLDGTLFDTLDDITASVNHVRATRDLAPWTRHEVRGCVGNGLRRLLIEAVQEPGGGDLGELVADYRRHHTVHLTDHTTAYPGVLEGLDELRAGGHPMAIVSNKPEDFSVRIVDHFSLNTTFRVVLGGDSTAHKKPHPAMVNEAASRLGVATSDCWMIGDSPTDIEAGRRAGCAERLAVTYGYRDEPELEGASILVQDFAKVVALAIAELE